MKKKYILRLKDIENISTENPNYSIIIKEVLGFNNFPIGRKHIFAKKFKEAHLLITEARKIDPTKVLCPEESDIKKPKNIDNISFRAMMELRSSLGGYNGETDFSLFVSKIIAIATYQENFKEDYNSNCKKFNDFQNLILKNHIWKMIGIYNWIDKAIKESDLEWSKRFMSVEVLDPDYELAGGGRMGQFNVVTTIKNICSDFNCNYDEAWQMSYVLTQTNSYAKATQNHIQDQMRQLKEIRMKSKSKN